MKKILYLLSLVFILLYACKENNTNERELTYDILFELRSEIVSRLDEAVVGDTDGCYSQASVDELRAALDELNIGISKARAGYYILQFEVDNYVLMAQKAIKLFDDSKIKNLAPGTPAELFVNGVDHRGYIDFGSSPDYCGGPMFTVETWTKNDPGFIEFVFGSFLSTFQPIPYKGWSLHYWGIDNSLIRFCIGTDNANVDLTLPIVYASSPSTYGQWFHLAAVFDSNQKTMFLYINGELKSSTAVNDNMVVNSSDDTRMWAFVEPRDNSRCMSGYIKKFRVWNTAKSGIEINNLMNSDVQGNENGLVCAWDFMITPENDEAIPDKTGNHTAKLVGIYRWKAIEE